MLLNLTENLHEYVELLQRELSKCSNHMGVIVRPTTEKRQLLFPCLILTGKGQITFVMDDGKQL